MRIAIYIRLGSSGRSLPSSPNVTDASAKKLYRYHILNARGGTVLQRRAVLSCVLGVYTYLPQTLNMSAVQTKDASQ